MKCALPGMYGRVIPIISEAMSNCSKEYSISAEEWLQDVQKAHTDILVEFEELQNEINDAFCKKDNPSYEQVFKDLLQKDKEEHE